ncbi:hypothetical protein HTZ84_17130 [Haloterrigena sp. SYSU A558-1]|uniref:Tat (Twin-arginine translocation) pathway signal sequence n=1 Tax=Haloterrigena gelatinilytica TaxID=2741724 RepID=A0ABX2LCL1_9EURY|nr:DUF6517 family protein [Haloterrigena gelatinilytica]NUC74004.1 hypothetical protein [Haloterrigena gelatinilytica]
MTFTRRGFLAAGATAGASALAGCTDFVADSLSSDSATVARGALEETGYAERTVEEVVVERTVGRFGLERTIEARNWYAEYDRALALDALGLGRLQASVVSVLTTPQVSVLGKTFNPVGDYSTDELVALIQSRYDELEGVERVGAESVSILGAETTLVRYRAEARLIDAGTTVDVFLQVGEPVAHGDDFVIGVAVFPQARGFETESGNVRTLLETLEHG